MATKAMLVHILPAMAIAALLVSASAAAKPLRGDYVSPYVNGCSQYYTWKSGDSCLTVVRAYCGPSTTKTWSECMGDTFALPSTTVTVCAGKWVQGQVLCGVKTCYYNGVKVGGCTGTFAEDEREGLASQ